MASNYFKSYDRTLRRFHVMNLVEQLGNESGNNFRASLVVNARTGHPLPLAEARPVRTEQPRI